MTEQVPTLDLNDSREDQLKTLDTALRQYGFFYVRHHGIDPSPQFDAAASLFRLNSDQKYAMSFDPWLDIGYVGTGTQNLDPNISSATITRHGFCHDDDEDGTVAPAQQPQAPPPGDTKEQFMQTNNILIIDPGNARIDPCHVFGGSRNYKVPDVPDFGEITQHYANGAYALNHRLNSLLFEALALSETQKQDLGANPFIVLKQMKYHGKISDPARGIFGANPHTDWGSFTILATDETPGLQILWNDTVWLPVPPRPGCLIINSGDQIAQLTNGVYKSAVHRVLTTSTKERFSTAVFTYFSIDCEVGPLDGFVTKDNPRRYPHRKTKDYFHEKLHTSMGTPVAA